jgi:serine/threonine protein kinase
MNIASENVRTSYAAQLSALEQRLRTQIDEASTVRDIQAAFEALLERSTSAEGDIRSVLERQYSAGNLRSETYQLVKRILDRIVSEQLATEPGNRAEEQQSSDPFIDTAVLPGHSFSPATPEDRLQVGSVLRDRFLLQEKVAGGSMGVVYKALDRRLAEVGNESSTVAIKVLSPRLSRNGNALRALQQEAAKGRCLSHPNIVRFIDLDRDDELYFIVMEWLEGRSLADILDDGRNNKIDANGAFDITRQIGQALDYAHRCGVVHADIKPGNIIITPEGQAKLFDFGVARIRQKQHAGQKAFDPAVMDAKTPVYSSMQVLTGEDPVPADDVFSLGCLLYRLLAGYRAFGPRNAAEAAEAGMEPQRIQGIAQAQWSALRKSLSYSRVSRFASVAEFLRALDGHSAAVEETQSLPVVEESHASPPWRRVVIAAMVFAAAGFILYQSGVVPNMMGSERRNAVETVHPTGTEVDIGIKRPLSGDEQPVATSDALVATPEAGDAVTTTNDEDLIAAQPVSESVEYDGSTDGEVAPPIPDFSAFPAADLVISLGSRGARVVQGQIDLIEDSSPATVEFIRRTDIGLSLSLRLEEVSYSGNRSPWESGQYAMQEDGIVEFAAGQDRVRTMITMASDPLREPDRDVVLRLRDAEYPDEEYAIINLNLRDDDQRRFEAGLPPNTVAFAVSQVSVRERDPAVQIDVLRFNPDSTELQVAYTVRDVTATDGEDYFTSSSGVVSFGPAQRTARIFVPLVQDAVVESDEAFMLELHPKVRTDDANIFTRIAVMIRDDDS